MDSALSLNNNVLDAIDKIEVDSPGMWELLVSVGIEASQQADNSRWLLGDLAMRVQKRYREDAIGKWAKDIHVAVDRIKEYRQVCTFWDREKSPRHTFLSEMPNLTYTHFRDSMRLKDIKLAKAFLEDCGLNDWSVEAARIELNKLLGKPVPPLKVCECSATLYFDGKAILLDVLPEYRDMLRGMIGKRLTLKLYESE